MEKLNILHLIDDTTAGGIMRMLDWLEHSAEMTRGARQSVQKVNRKAFDWGNFDADVIVSHVTAGWRSLPALASLRAKHPNTRLVHVEHSYTRAFTDLNVRHTRRFHTMLRITYSLFDQIVAVSNNQAVWIKERRLTSAEHLFVIQPEVDLSLFHTIAPPTGKIRTIGAIGRLEPQKGFDVLIEGFRMCENPASRLVIIGDGSQRKSLEKLAEGDPRIEFLGHFDDPVEAYSMVDMVVMPSRWEAYGLVAEEARAAMRPVIVSDVDGLSDRAEKRGITTCKFSPASWARKLDAVFSDAPVSRPKRQNGPDLNAKNYARRWWAVFGMQPEKGWPIATLSDRIRPTV